MMITLTSAQLFFMVALVLYGIYEIVNRICNCLERRSYAKMFEKYHGNPEEIIAAFGQNNTKNVKK